MNLSEFYRALGNYFISEVVDSEVVDFDSSSNTTTSEKILSPSQVPFDISVKNSLSCPHCGVANRVDSLYCCRCGKTMISTNKQCPSCRKIYEKDCAFCKYCGTKLVEC